MNTLARIVRATGSVVVWVLSALGVVSLGVWGLTSAGLMQPLIVVSGSMSPGIATGDLLVALPTDASELAVGEVASLHSTRHDTLVTHRIVSIAEVDGGFAVRMQGDANNAPDAEEYFVAAGTDVWQPRWTIPGGGTVIMSIMRPAVSIPAAIGLFALAALSLLPRDRTPRDDAAATTKERFA